MIKKYQKKPVVIEAVQWTGDNLEEIKSFVGDTDEEYSLLVAYQTSVLLRQRDVHYKM